MVPIKSRRLISIGSERKERKRVMKALTKGAQFNSVDDDSLILTARGRLTVCIN